MPERMYTESLASGNRLRMSAPPIITNSVASAAEQPSREMKIPDSIQKNCKPQRKEVVMSRINPICSSYNSG
jgi:hypothetical protein